MWQRAHFFTGVDCPQTEHPVTVEVVSPSISAELVFFVVIARSGRVSISVAITVPTDQNAFAYQAEPLTALASLARY